MTRSSRALRARRAVVCLLAVALSGGSLAACGDDGEDAPTGAAAVLEETFGPGKPIDSGDVTAAVTFDATGLKGVDGPVRLSLTGPFQTQGDGRLPLFDFAATLAAGGTSFTAGAVSAPNRGFLSLQGAASALPASVYRQLRTGYEASVKASEKDEGSRTTLQGLGVDPVRWLRAPRTVGTEEVGGVEATHVSATVDVPEFLADVDRLLKKAGTVGSGQAAAAGVPDGLSAIQQTAIASAITSTRFDVWAGREDGTLRRLDLAVAFDVPEIARSRVGGLQKGKVGLTFTIADLGKEQEIAAPTSLRPFGELQAALATLLGGVLGGGGGSAAPATGTGPANPPAAPAAASPSGGAQSDYDACMTAAGADIAKVNSCAPLLNP